MTQEIKKYDVKPTTEKDMQYFTYLLSNGVSRQINAKVSANLLNWRDENKMIAVQSSNVYEVDSFESETIQFFITDDGELIDNHEVYVGYEWPLELAKKVLAYCKLAELTPRQLVQTYESKSDAALNDIASQSALYILFMAKGCVGLANTILSNPKDYNMLLLNAAAKELAKKDQLVE